MSIAVPHAISQESNPNSMKPGKYLGLIILAIVLISCNPHNTIQEINTIEADIETHFVDKVEILESFEIKLIPLESNENCWIRVVDKILFTSSKIVVSDARIDKVFFFDTVGHYLNHMNPVPEPGPGEFNKIKDICIVGDKLYINDYRQILIFSLDQKWIKTNKLQNPVDRIEGFENRLYCYSSNQVFNDPTRLSSYSLDLTDYNAFNTEQRQLGSLRLLQTFNLFKTESELIFTTYYLDTIYSVTNNEIHPKHIISFKNKVFPPKEFSLSSPTVDKNIHNKLRESNNPYRLMNYIENERLIFFTFSYNNSPVKI